MREFKSIYLLYIYIYKRKIVYVSMNSSYLGMSYSHKTTKSKPYLSKGDFFIEPLYAT